MNSQSSPSQPDQQALEQLEKFRFYRVEIRHEYDLITGRLNAHLTAQSFLVLAYATAMNVANSKNHLIFPLLFCTALAALGFLLSYHTWKGISAAVKTINHWHAKIQKLCEVNPMLADFQSGREKVNPKVRNGITIDTAHEDGLTFPRRSPIIFMIAWATFEFFAVAWYATR